MRIVIPTGEGGLDSDIAEHFGRCKTYTFIDEEGSLIEIIKNTSEHMGGKGLPPELMKKHGAEILLCRGIGSRALELCKKLDIDVYVSQANKVSQIFALWKEGKIKKAGVDDACD